MRYHWQHGMSFPPSQRGEGLAWIQDRVVDFATSLLGLYGLDQSKPDGGRQVLAQKICPIRAVACILGKYGERAELVY
jgi:hypothetical protein